MLERGALRVGRRSRVNFDARRLTTGRHPGSHNVPPGRLMHETRARAFYPPLEPRRPSPSAPATPASIYTHLGRSQSAQEHATTAQKTPRCGWCISSSVERRRNFLGISPDWLDSKRDSRSNERFGHARCRGTCAFCLAPVARNGLPRRGCSLQPRGAK